MAQDLAGRVALVTGAARGLGRAAAERLVAGGACVGLNVRRPEEVAALGGVIGGPGADRGGEDGRSGGGGQGGVLGERAMALLGDVAGADAVQAMVERLVERFGRLDILVN